MRNPAWSHLVYPSRALFHAFREALARRLAPGSFPAMPPAWDDSTPPPGYTAQPLAGGVLLHLTDGRTWRKSGDKALLGKAQLDAMEAAMRQAPAGTVHLVASGSVVEANTGDAWVWCEDEYRRLMDLGTRHDILVLSGDIHDNNLAAYDLPGGRRLYEATASGAALKKAVNLGSLQRNWGMLAIDDGAVGIEILKSGKTNYQGTISRATWR